MMLNILGLIAITLFVALVLYVTRLQDSPVTGVRATSIPIYCVDCNEDGMSRTTYLTAANVCECGSSSWSAL